MGDEDSTRVRGMDPTLEDRSQAAPSPAVLSAETPTDSLRAPSLSSLLAIVRGVEAEVGERFFPSLVQSLATALDVPYAYVSELHPDGTRFQSHAAWGRGHLLPVFDVPLGGPCEAVLQRQIVHHPDGLPEIYPQVRVIVEWGAVSYCGVPLVDRAGRVVGHLAILDDKPMPDGAHAESIMRIFAARAEAEIERLRVERSLRHSDHILRAIAEGTAAETGERFFQSLVRSVAIALGVRYTFLAEMTDFGARVRTLAFWNHDSYLDNFEYDVAGTPCEKVLEGQICHYPEGVQSLFPCDRDLAKMEVQSYLAIPLIDPSGRVLGHLAALDVRPLLISPEDVTIFKIFGSRAGAELQRKRAEEALRKADLRLRQIDEGTASVTGDEFFHSLVRNLAAALHVQYAFVSEFTEVRSRVRTLAFWTGEAFLDNFDYDVHGTPCEEVLRGEICHYPERVQGHFPHHRRELASLDAESYLAVPLVNQTGEVLGHLAVIDTKPMHADARELSIFKIFGARAAAELERMRVETKLRESEERLARVIGSAMDAIVTIDGERRIRLFNSAAEHAFRCVAATVLDTSLDRFLSEGFRKVLDEYLVGEAGAGSDTPARWLPEHLAAARADGEEFPVEGTLARVKVGGQWLYTLILRDINERRKAEAELRRLQGLALYLQEEIQDQHNFEELVGSSSGLKKVLTNVSQVAATGSTVLLTGETGTGKELIARAIHHRSPRTAKPLVKVNCAAIPAGLIESELFGHEKGAFTGALIRKIGRFELADGGTIFLDEIGELPIELQPKLLRVLQEGEFERLGSPRTLKVNVRVIAATNRDLEQRVQEGAFRADLYYRLNVFPIHLPPLRERSDDIPLLVKYFARKYATKLGKPIETVPQAAITALQSYDWPGNIRELENVLERAVILSRDAELDLGDWLPRRSASPLPSAVSGLQELERAHILKVLDLTGWRVSGDSGAARLLGLKPTTLEARMKKLGIARRT